MNEHLPSIPARLGANPLPPALTEPELQPMTKDNGFAHVEQLLDARDVLRCLLSYESDQVESGDTEPSEQKVFYAQVPLHVFEQARNALGVSK